ncbi:hypothetical protein AMTR_s00032p00227420 [Amborella trichopoda]|uniref:FAD-binding PCMH-type domain-containing protein n=2 Tax=Amborella trichopoda TaxID=13333 RepID=U5D3R0_AMBTC|nr:hypothetical protein AMTR_s00032p00227420 [Amborella trichopoda]
MRAPLSGAPPAATLRSLSLILLSLLLASAFCNPSLSSTTNSLSKDTSTSSLPPLSYQSLSSSTTSTPNSLTSNTTSQHVRFRKCLSRSASTPIPTQPPSASSISAPHQPIFILHPETFDHVQASIKCAGAWNLQIRTRSGGHDYASLSSISLSRKPFVVLDLAYLREITLAHDRAHIAMWVHAGATLGELYHSIEKLAPNHAFPAGLCPTVGVGGHISGGGFGTLVRKFGLAADNVIDALIVDQKGRILNRETMGEDLFWAIRGGGAASFCVVVSWKLRLVPIPYRVTVFTIQKTPDQNAIPLVYKWQYIAHRLPENLFIRVVMQRYVKKSRGKGKTGKNGPKTRINAQKKRGDGVTVEFNSLYLGNCSELKRIMDQWFPELGFSQANGTEISWIQSVLYFSGYKLGTSIKVLLDRKHVDHLSFKAKSDYLYRPIPEKGLRGIWKWLEKEEKAFAIIDPYGGKMEEIAEDETPFPHRAGSLYNIQYIVKWEGEGDEEKRKHEDWITGLYKYMVEFVSEKPRAAYLNYRDLDLGVNGGSGDYEEARGWGEKYFKGKFRRLAMVKAAVDGEDFFWNEQSIPVLKQ